MSKISDIERLLTRVCLHDVVLTSSTTKGISFNPLLVGSQGIGKSAICKAVAERLGGTCLTLECSAMKEGEITGIPYSQDNGHGKKELQFIPYFLVSQIQELEKAYYKKATEEGYLDGRVKLVLNQEATDDYNQDIQDEKLKENIYDLVYVVDGQTHVVKAKNKYSSILNNRLNRYKFGNELPASLKIELLKSGEMQTVVLFLDEINRTTPEVMKEYMNIILTRVVNGYDFPWWVRIIAAENPAGSDSDFATNEMDPAQLDRFLQLKVTADVKEWTESYAIEKGLDDRYILAISSLQEFFIDKKQTNNEDRTTSSSVPTPRSHELCAHIYGDQDIVNNSGFFTAEELDPLVVEKDITTLINGKIGTTAGTAIYARLKNSEDYINPNDVINGKSNHIEKKIYDKIKSTRNFAAKIVLARGIVNIIATDLIRYYFIKLYSTNISEKKKASDKWTNIMEQIEEFTSLIDKSAIATFTKLAKSTFVNVTDEKLVNMSKYNNVYSIFRPIAPAFSSDVVGTIHMTDDVINSGDIDKD